MRRGALELGVDLGDRGDAEAMAGVLVAIAEAAGVEDGDEGAVPGEMGDVDGDGAEPVGEGGLDAAGAGEQVDQVADGDLAEVEIDVAAGREVVGGDAAAGAVVARGVLGGELGAMRDADDAGVAHLVVEAGRVEQEVERAVAADPRQRAGDLAGDLARHHDVDVARFADRLDRVVDRGHEHPAVRHLDELVGPAGQVDDAVGQAAGQPAREAEAQLPGQPRHLLDGLGLEPLG